MTNYLEPNRVQVTPTYVCRKCDSKHYETIEYVNKIGKILCDCGDVLHLKPITTFKVYPIYEDHELNQKTQPVLEKENNSLEQSQEQQFTIDVYAENEDDDFLSLSEAAEFLRNEEDEIENNSLPDLPEWLTKANDYKPKNKQKPDLFASEDVFEQCVDFLISLGYKKTDAKKKVNKNAANFNRQICANNFDEFAKSLLFA